MCGSGLRASRKIDEYAENIGIAFQLADDLLDEGNENSIVSLIGEEEAKDLLLQKTEKACAIAREYFVGEELSAFAKALAVREK